MRLTEQIGFSPAPAARAGKTDGMATVVVNCCGQLEYTRLCVPSLLRYTRQPYALLFLDADSRDGTVEYLEGLAVAAPVPIEVARVPGDPPMGSGRKDEAIPLRGEFVALLNNDVIVTQSWLDQLISLAASAPNIGMVAPMSNHGQQALRVDNISYAMDDWQPAEIGKFAATDSARVPRSNPWPLIDRVNRFAVEWREKHANEKLEPEVLSGGCVLLKREVLQKLGQFPTRMPLGTFDTVALAQLVRQTGFRLAACKDLYVHSFGSRG